MTDKKHTLLVFLQTSSPEFTSQAQKVLDDLVRHGNTSMLALRKASVTETFGLFEAVSSISQVSPTSDLAGRLQSLTSQARDSVSRIEKSFFGDGSPKDFVGLFHRPPKAALLTPDEDLAKHALTFGLKTIERETFMEPLMIMASELKPSPEEMAFFPELLILHSVGLTAEEVELIETLRASKLFTI